MFQKKEIFLKHPIQNQPHTSKHNVRVLPNFVNEKVTSPFSSRGARFKVSEFVLSTNLKSLPQFADASWNIKFIFNHIIRRNDVVISVKTNYNS